MLLVAWKVHSLVSVPLKKTFTHSAIALLLTVNSSSIKQSHALRAFQANVLVSRHGQLFVYQQNIAFVKNTIQTPCDRRLSSRINDTGANQVMPRKPMIGQAYSQQHGVGSTGD